MAIVTPITRDPVERAAIERDLAGDPLAAIEIILADTIRRASRIEARLASSLAPEPPAAFRRVVEQQRRDLHRVAKQMAENAKRSNAQAERHRINRAIEDLDDGGAAS